MLAVRIIFRLVGLCGLATNSLVTYSILANKSLRTTSNLLLVNVAAADTIYVVANSAFDFALFDVCEANNPKK